jgi:queuosine precursor transporter
MQAALIAVYLSAMVLANIAVAFFGPSSTVVIAFLFIGLTLSTRDKLHDLWGRNVARNMVLLIGLGGVLSYLATPDAGRIAFASLSAFLASESFDAVLYARLRRRPYLIRSNGSNLLGAAVDSLVFPTLAFGVLMPGIILAEFAAKVLGGFLWSLLFNAIRVRRHAKA